MNIRDITISKRDSLVQLLLYRKVNIKTKYYESKNKCL